MSCFRAAKSIAILSVSYITTIERNTAVCCFGAVLCTSMRILFFLSAAALAGCAAVAPPAQPDAGGALPPSAVSEPEQENGPPEQVPAELSIEYFAGMRLQGTGLTLGTVLEDNTAYTRYTISYLSNGLTISGIMNIPKGEGPFPLVLLNHGYIDPAVYTNGRGLRREQDYLARQGFAVLHSDYRGHAASDPSPDERQIYDAGLEYSMDVVNAVHAVRAADLPRVDARRIGMLGHSMGGGIGLNIAVAHPNLVHALVLYAPVHADAWQNFMRWRDMREEGDRTREAMGARAENPEAWDALSSLTFLDRIQTPVALFHGTNDADVPVEWSNDLATELERRGKNVTYTRYENEAHEFIPRWNAFMERSTQFFREHLTEQPSIEQFSPLLPRADERVTKKPFGIFITPDDSPVQPERFRGYHTGADYELLPDEAARDLTVRAVCDGTVVLAQHVNGYGGVVVQRCTHRGEPITALYGHLALTSVQAIPGTELQAGDAIGSLGEGYGAETDGERTHLHLAFHRGSTVELRGYVQDAATLDAWIDPAILLR